MPERNGLEVTKAIRAMESSAVRLPIMILSASVTADARERARKAGADEFVGKPYEASALLQTIDRMSRRARNTERSAHQSADVEKSGAIHDLRVANAVLVDATRLSEVRRIAGDPEFLSRLVAGFRNDLMRLIAGLTDVLNNAQLSKVPDLTHAIKGAALGIGALRLAAIAVELEQHSAAGHDEAAKAALTRLQRCFDETSTTLEAQLSTDSRVATR